MSESFDRQARGASLRLIVIAAVVLMVGVGIVVAAVSSLTGDGGDPQAPSASSGPQNPDEGAGDDDEPGDGEDGPMTPERAETLQLPEPRGHRQGMAYGWHQGLAGAIAAAVSIQETLDLLDDARVRTQMEAVTSPHSPEVVDQAVTRTRKLREALGLPPSGPAPAGFSVTTTVKAVRIETLSEDPLVQEVWMVYDRHATGPDGAPDDDPLLDQMDSITVIWEYGDWRVTDAHAGEGSYPVPYHPDSPEAWDDGWTRVTW